MMKKSSMLHGDQPHQGKVNFCCQVVISPHISQEDMDFLLDEIELHRDRHLFLGRKFLGQTNGNNHVFYLVINAYFNVLIFVPYSAFAVALTNMNLSAVMFSVLQKAVFKHNAFLFSFPTLYYVGISICMTFLLLISRRMAWKVEGSHDTQRGHIIRRVDRSKSHPAPLDRCL